MTDRELLEKAAKAAGNAPSGISFLALLNMQLSQWNPLTDDGDALRLAIDLDLNVFQAAASAYAMPSEGDGSCERAVRYIDAWGDKRAATRRAIVRAAAALADVGEYTPT